MCRAMLAETPDIARYRDSLAGWSDKLVRLLNTAPTRTDMTIVFFVARIQIGAWQTVESLARALLDSNPDDPIANWYLGQYLLNRGEPASRAASVAALQKSLNNGIERIIRVSPEFESQLLATTGRSMAEPSQNR